jgi:Ca2+-binding EF-hand superfamily protein
MTRIRIALVAAGLLAGAATVAAARPHGGHDGPRGWDHFAEKHDTNGDGAVAREELSATAADDRFARLDENADGRVTEDEFRAAIAGRVLGHLAMRADEDRNGELTQAVWRAFLAALDEDGDGSLEMRHRRRGPAGEGEAERAFPGDTDGDGAFELAEAQALFGRFDENRDGVLTEEELPTRGERHDRFGHGMHGRGGHAEHMMRLDSDGDDSVSRAEWDAHVAKRQGEREGREERRSEMFDRLDADGDGELSREELEAGRPRGPRGRRG